MLRTNAGQCLDPAKDLRQYGRRSWQTDNGLPQNTVHAIVQSHDGYLWFATEAGLVRFDGAQFVVYDRQSPAHLPSDSVNSLLEDASGDLWIGTEDGLVRRRGESFRTFTTADGLPSNSILSLTEQSYGDMRADLVWVITAGGVALHYPSDRFQQLPIAGGIAGAKSIAVTTNGSLWIGTRSSLLHGGIGGIEGTPSLTGAEIQSVTATPHGMIWVGTRSGLYSFESRTAGVGVALQGLPSNEITALTSGGDGSLWIGTAKGLALLKGGALTVYTTRNGLPADRVDSIYIDREGAAWIAMARGLARIAGGKVRSLSSPDPLATEQVLSLFEDREGSLWIGTASGGVEMLHDQKFTSYTTAEGLSDDMVRSVVQGRDGSVWVGTNGGGVDHFEDGRFTRLTTANGLSSDIVLALADDGERNLWVGTPDGLDRVPADHAQGGRIQVYTSADGLADDFVRSIYPAQDASLWIGTRRGLSHFQNGRFTSYSKMDGLGSDLVGAIVEDRAHTLWIATLGGLTRLDHGRLSTLTTRDGLAGDVITALHPDGEGDLWVGANQGGLSRVRDGAITTYPAAATGLPESIYAILEDAAGNLWLSAKTGIYSVSRRQLNDFAVHRSGPITPAMYGTADGMKVSEGTSGGHPAAWRLADGSMWFATLKGIAAVDPEHLARNGVPPPVAIEQVLTDDRPVTEGDPLTVSAGVRRFEFHYAAMSFIAPQKVRYRYRLDGFDRDWVEAGARRTAYYTNLPPGRYVFHVIACNNDGLWNLAGATLRFRLKPHYYQTLWFYLVLLLGTSMLAYAVYRWRVRQVELRYNAVLSERGRIAREIHDTLAQGLVGISVQLELVNRLLASSVEGARAQLDQTRALVRESLSEARSSIWELRSQAAETEDFATRLGRMAATATGNAVPKIRVKSKVSGTYRPLPPRTETELLRIAQEAVTNAVRHASPSGIAIELRFAARELEMTIQDDGRGFDGKPHPQASGPDGHFGLAGMRERAEQIGGTLTVESAPGKGTRITACIPLNG